MNDPPEKLADRDIWLIWKLGYRGDMDPEEDKPTKIPLNPDTGYNGSATDPAIRVSFEDAIEALDRYDEADGVGFAFPEGDLLAGVDLDDVRDPETGDLDKWAREIVTTLDSYTEVSPSGTGVHVVVFGFKPGERCKTAVGEDSEIEMYDENRFFTYTGERLGDGFDTVEVRKEGYADVYHEYFGEEDDDGDDPDVEAPDLDLDDEDVLEKARDASNGEKFERLWGGYDPNDDPSYGDKGLCQMLAFWTGGDRQQMDRLFRASDRVRPKWDEDRGDVTYGERTIDAAVSDQTEFYEPGSGKPTPPSVAAAQDIVDKQSATDGGVAAESGDGGPGPDNEGWIGGMDALEKRVFNTIEELADDDQDLTTTMAVDRIATAFDEELHFLHPERNVSGWRSTLYIYDGSAGVYEPRGESFLENKCEEMLDAFATNQRVREVVGKVSRRNYARGPQFDTPPERIVVGNGILDLTTGDLDDHTPDEYHTTRIGVDYRPDAECPAIDQWFGEVVEDSDVGTLYRIAAHTLYREYIAEKAVMLVGGGQNGKSIYTWLLETFLNPVGGDGNTSGVSLADVSSENFAVNQLHGKLANINSDINSADVEDLGKFKQLTGRDWIMADVKYETPIRFINHASMIFAVNQMPSFGEDTHALWRRWVYLKFPYTFKPGDDETEPKREIQARIGADAELEGLLARCVEELGEWDRGREMFPDVPDPEEIREMMLQAAEPVYDFAKVCLREDTDGAIPKDRVRAAFRAYATEEGLTSDAAMDPGRFGEKLMQAADIQIDAKRKRVNGDRVQAYTGIEFTQRGEQVLGGGESIDDSQTDLNSSGPPDDAVGSDANGTRVRNLLAEQEPLEKVMLQARAGDQLDLSPEQAKYAVEKLSERGEIYETDDGWRTT